MKRRDLIKLAATIPFVGLPFKDGENRKLTPEIIEEIGDKLLPKINKASKSGKPGEREDYDNLLSDFLEYTQIRTEKQLVSLIKTNIDALMKYDILATKTLKDDETNVYFLHKRKRYKENETPFFYNHTGLMRQMIVEYGKLSKYGIKQV